MRILYMDFDDNLVRRIYRFVAINSPSFGKEPELALGGGRD